MEFPYLKNNSAVQKVPIVVLLTAATTLIILSIVPLIYFPLRNYPSTLLKTTTTTSSDEPAATVAALHSRLVEEKVIRVADEEGGKCDIFVGEWVWNPDAPYYTNTTCWAIHEHQNCMKYGRPDDGFMKWRWKPDGCELPIFNPYQFLDMMRGKSMAFVGDSVGRNHMQSLVCLLSRVEYPVDDSGLDEADVDDYFRRWKYPNYNFTLAAFWTTYLVKSQQVGSENLFKLYLDEIDVKWSSKMQEFDYVIINTGQWFFRPTVYYENNQLLGCHSCQMPNVTKLPVTFAYRKAWKTALKAIRTNNNRQSVIFLRTYAPSHFEGGDWNEGGNCLRKRPFRSSEITLGGVSLDVYLTQLEEFRAIEEEGKKKGLRFRLLDITQAMLLRPDGHPSKYGHWPNANVTLYNDCVHWCLPGPVDSWNDFLLQMLKMEGRRSYEEKIQPKRKERRLIN